MKKTDITYVTGSVFASVASIFYFCIMHFHITVPRYFPTEHTWKMHKVEGLASQGWYGMQTYAYVVAGIVAFIVYMVLKAKTNDTPLKPVLAKRIGISVSVIVTTCLVLILHHQFRHWGIF